MRWLVFTTLLVATTGCDVFGPDDDTDPGDGCVDYQITDFWFWQPDASYVPGAMVRVPTSAGGFDSEGIGVVVTAEIDWDGVRYHSLPTEEFVIGLPMEPGTYTVRRQSPYCASQGVDQLLTVAHPTGPTQTTAPPVSGEDAQALAVAVSPDSSRYSAIIKGQASLFRTEFDAFTDEVLTTWTCERCSTHLAYADNGGWMAHGNALYQRRGEAWFLVTTFTSDHALSPLNILFPPNDGEALLQGEDGLIFNVNLTTGEREVFFYASELEQITPDGRVLADGVLYDLDSGGVLGTDLPAYLAIWSPSTNRGLLTGDSSSPTLGLAQILPFQWVEDDGVCSFSYQDRQLRLDPLEEYIVAFGRRNSGPNSGNPWFESCVIESGWTGLGSDQPTAFPFEGIPDLQRTVDAAWMPDGSALLTAGLRGITRHERSTIDALHEW